MAKERPHFDILIEDLQERHVAETAAIHADCFPEKLETRLGQACIADCLRRRYIQPGGDCFCRVAVLKSTGQVVGYCHAEQFRHGDSLANAFLNPAIAKAHLLRSGWLRPRVWVWVLARIWGKITHRGLRNEGDSLAVRDDWEVAKMLGIHRDFRGGNIGKDLMLDNEAEARNRGSTRICGLIARDNIKAERLYASIGWVRTSDSGDAFDVFAMHKELIPQPEVKSAAEAGLAQKPAAPTRPQPSAGGLIGRPSAV